MSRSLVPLAAALALWPALSLAQTATLTQRDLFRGTGLPPTSAALADDPSALSLNPAGLSEVGSASLLFVHERSVLRNQVADGLYLADSFFGVGAGFSLDWVRSTSQVSYRKTSWGLSFGSPLIALGAAYNVFSSDQDPALNAITSFDLGLLWRPFRFLSLGAAVKNIDAPVKGGLALPRQYDVGVGVRPFNERFTLALDYVTPESAGLGDGRLGYTLQAELLPGLVLLGGVSHDLRFAQGLSLQLGLTVNSPHLGLTYAPGGSPQGLDHVIALRVSAQPYPALSASAGKIALVDLRDRLTSSRSAAAEILGFREEDPYLRLTRFLDQAVRDPELAGVVIKIDNLPGVRMGKADELRSAIYRLRAAGKKVVAVLLTAGDTDYAVATAADRIYALPQSMLLINGLSASTTFLGTAMTKLGVQWDVARVGAYKNAPDALTRSSMSPEQKEAVSAYLNTDVRQYQAAVERGRRISPAQLKTIFAEGLVSPQRAQALRLVDEVIVPEQLEDRLQALVPNSRYEPHYSPWDKREQRWGTRRKIALVPVLGTIAGGKSRQAPFGIEEIAGADTVVRALKRAEEDPSVAAVVLRVDSGGGDGLASDLMYRAVLEAKRKKPVVASMGDVAASGGYYAAVGADEIFASPTTITGSIGVFVLKPAVGQLAAKLGISHETLSAGPMSELFSLFKPWGAEERAAAQRWVDAFYEGFIAEVAGSRRLTREQVDEVARGRVWSGEDALAHKLVDSMGGLIDAIDAAKRRAGVRPSEEVDLVVLGEPHGLFVGPGGEEGALASLARALLPGTPSAPLPVAQLAQELGLSPTLLSPGLKAALPFRLRVE